jgi:hypothetical protein
MTDTYKLIENVTTAQQMIQKWRCFLGRTTSERENIPPIVQQWQDVDWFSLNNSGVPDNITNSTFWVDDPTGGTNDYRSGCSGNIGQLITNKSDGNGGFSLKAMVVPGTGKGKDTNNRVATVRMESTQQYTGGIFILDVTKVPSGCGAWPAWWLQGGPEDWSNTDTFYFNQKWPTYGEIDILEQVNGQNWNQSTLHVGGGENSCKLNTNSTPTPENVDCYAGTNTIPGAIGCGTIFNKNKTSGGEDADGLYICEWEDNNYIKYWYIPRLNIPIGGFNTKDTIDLPTELGDLYDNPDITHDLTDTCDQNNIRNQHQIINTVLCGQWAGDDPDGVCTSGDDPISWTGGSDACADALVQKITDDKIPINQPDAGFLRNYRWDINSIRSYSKTLTPPPPPSSGGKGAKGDQGDQGDKGDKGAQGAQGAPGKDESPDDILKYIWKKYKWYIIGILGFIILLLLIAVFRPRGKLNKE